MVLTIDIGNTTIGIGGFQGNKLLFIEKLSSRRPLSDAGYRKKLNMILDKHGLSAEAFEGSVISSVVPSVTAVFSSALEAFLGQKPLLLTHELDLGYEICTEFPEIYQIADRCIVMYKGKINGSLEREELNEAGVMALSTGTKTEVQV